MTSEQRRCNIVHTIIDFVFFLVLLNLRAEVARDRGCDRGNVYPTKKLRCLSAVPIRTQIRDTESFIA